MARKDNDNNNNGNKICMVLQQCCQQEIDNFDSYTQLGKCLLVARHRELYIIKQKFILDFKVVVDYNFIYIYIYIYDQKSISDGVRHCGAYNNQVQNAAVTLCSNWLSHKVGEFVLILFAINFKN